MSQLTLAQVLRLVRSHIPGLPQDKVVDNLNLTLEEVHEEIAQIEWGTFTTRAQVQTGTVSVTNNAVSVTFSSAVLTFPVTNILIFCRIDPDGTWFMVTPSSTTVGALSSAYAGATDAAATYTIVYPVIVLPAAVGKVLSIQSAGYPALTFADRDNMAMRAEVEIVGRPLWYGSYDTDPNATPDDAERLVLTPFPDATYSFNYSYMKRQARIATNAATTVTVGLAASYDRTILEGTLARCLFQEKGESVGGPWWGRYQKSLKNARGNTNTGVAPRLQTAREARRNTLYAVQYPPA